MRAATIRYFHSPLRDLSRTECVHARSTIVVLFAIHVNVINWPVGRLYVVAMKSREKYGNDNPTAVRSDPSLKPIKEEIPLPAKAEEVNPTMPMMPLQTPLNPLPSEPVYTETPSMQPSADMHGSFTIPFGMSQPSQPGMFHEVNMNGFCNVASSR